MKPTPNTHPAGFTPGKRYRLRAKVTSHQLRDCALGAAVDSGLRRAVFEFEEVGPRGFPSVFDGGTTTGTICNASRKELNGYRVPLMFCVIHRATKAQP